MRSIDIVITISQCITPPKAPFLGHSCVGYNTLVVNRGGFVLGAPQFKECEETGGDVQDLAEVIKTDAPCTDMAGDAQWSAEGTCAYIMVKNSEVDPTYDFYYYCCDSSEEEPTPPTAGWWMGDLETPLTDKLALGRGAWFVIPNNETFFTSESYKFSFAGGVKELDRSVSVPLANKAYTIAANAFPAPLTGANITFSPGVPCTDMAGEAQWSAEGTCVAIMVKNSQEDPTYDFYYYCCDSSEEEPTPPTAGWWMGDLETPWETPIARGEAFWIVVPDGLLTDDKQTITFSL